MYEVFNMICPYELFNHLSACLYYRNVCQDNKFCTLVLLICPSDRTAWSILTKPSFK